MYRYKCIVKYDGYNYMGFQIQNELPTIELYLVEAIKKMLGVEVKIYASGRTDRYVHAVGQVFHFDLESKIPAKGLEKGINSYLPPDIHISHCEEVNEEFHSRFSAKSKEYRYYINYKEYNPLTIRYAPNITNLNIDKMYEALNPESTAKAWYTLPSTKSDSKNVSNKNAGVIPVTTDCEISNFRFINGKPIALGADSIQGNTWADGTVSTSTTTTQKYVANNLGNYYIVEEDENGSERWVEYRNNVLHGVHVYDAIEIDYNGTETLMFAVGTGSSSSSSIQRPAKILTNKNTRSYASPKFYLKDGSEYMATGSEYLNNRIYNFFKTDAGIFAFYAHQGGTDKKIFKYNYTNGEHRFDEVRDISFGTSTSSDTRNYQQSDVNSSGTAVSTRRLWTDFMRAESYNGYAYYTTGYLYKTKTFEKSATTAITAPNSAIISDLIVRDGVLYALGFKKTNSTTNAYTNYIWSIDTSDKFTEIRNFTSTGAYALSFDKDAEFFYVGLGGPTTHITDSVKNVGNIIKLSINPVQ